MRQHRLYDDLAWLWPIFSPPEEYAAEAECWRSVLRDRLGPGRHEILELGVGGGHNLSHLTNDFQATAVDLSGAMLENCHRLNPGVSLHLGDMRSVRLGRTFRAVLINDAITHMLTEHDLRQVFATAAAHLGPGGLLLMTPDHFRETFHPPRASHSVHSGGGIHLTVFEYEHDPDPDDTVAEIVLIYMIQSKEGLRIEQDRLQVGLFPLQCWIDLMEEAGFAVDRHPYPFHEDQREAWMLVGTLPGEP